MTGAIGASGGKQPSELSLRIVFGVLLAGMAFAAAWIGGQVFAGFTAILAALVFFEFQRLCAHQVLASVRLLAGSAVLVSLAAWFVAPTWTIVIGGLAVAVVGIWEWLLGRSSWIALGVVYTVAPFVALNTLRGDSAAGFLVLLVLFACVWGADTVAYATGRTLGGPKLAPKLSPAKTWSGFVGGLAGAVAIAGLVAWLAGYRANGAFFALALVLALSSQVGDLLESALKRRFGAKDSGNLIPGHGGVLDRLDGLILAAVVAWIIALWVAADVSGGSRAGGMAETLAGAIMAPR